MESSSLRDANANSGGARDDGRFSLQTSPISTTTHYFAQIIGTSLAFHGNFCNLELRVRPPSFMVLNLAERISGAPPGARAMRLK